MDTVPHSAPPENPLMASSRALQDGMNVLKKRLLDLTFIPEMPPHPGAGASPADPVEAFARAVSADLAQPVSALTTYLNVSDEGYKGRLDPEAKAFMGYLADEAKRMQSLVNGLSAYLEAGSGERVIVHCGQPLAAARLRLQAKIADRGAQMTLGALPTLTTDPAALALLFEHLIDNAIRFCDAVPSMHISASRVGAMWRFVVQDNGIGIAVEDQRHIFDLFFHKAEANGGPGIGLAVCHKMVWRLGGQIEVLSGVGKGSSFTFTLPAE